MELVDVASFFDKVPARDPVSGRLLFNCQVLAYDESKRDAYTAYRRIMSTNPDVVIPSTRVISLYGSTWLVGDNQIDGWDTLHRSKSVLHRAKGVASIYRLDGFLAGTPAVQPWADLQWVQDKKELEVSSNVPQKHAVVLPDVVDVRPLDVVVLADECIFVSAVSRHASGFTEATGFKQLWTAPTTLSVQTRTYSPTTGGYTAGVTANFSAVRVRWQELFMYEDQMAERYQEGDHTWVLPMAANVTTSSELVVGTERYTVLAVRAVNNCRVVHARLK
jgi:hypothetical protein